VLAELAERVRALNPRALVISEMETGDMRPIEVWGHDAQWADEFHHELHVLLSREHAGYYANYDGSVEGLARQLERRPPSRLVFCSQNHDQVGNRALGDRPASDELAIRAAALLFAPQTPLLFMGEEYGERRPFMFFTDHADPAIASATREGRVREVHGGVAGAELPDPQDPATFERSKLDPSHGDAVLLALYTRLLAFRRLLRASVEAEVEVKVEINGGLLRLARGRAVLILNFSDGELDGVPRRGVRLDV
jgi:maltooligosyltrehalose trehalohydrolase